MFLSLLGGSGRPSKCICKPNKPHEQWTTVRLWGPTGDVCAVRGTFKESTITFSPVLTWGTSKNSVSVVYKE